MDQFDSREISLLRRAVRPFRDDSDEMYHLYEKLQTMEADLQTETQT